MEISATVIMHNAGLDMSTLTITTDEEILKKARRRALAEGTSVNAVLRDYLAVYAGVKQDHRAALHRLLSLSNSIKSGRRKQRWSRESLSEVP